MWNSKKCAAMAIAAAGLAVAAATPAAAWGPGYYGSVGCGSYYGAAWGAGSIGCGDYGYAGTFAYGWPYAANIGVSYLGGAYGSGGDWWNGFGSWGSYGYAPAFGYASWGCGRAHRARGYGYAVASRHPHGYPVASYQGRPHAIAAHAPVDGLRSAAVRPAQSRIVARSTTKLAHAD